MRGQKDLPYRLLGKYSALDDLPGLKLDPKLTPRAW